MAAGIEDGEMQTRSISFQCHSYLSILGSIFHGIGQQVEVDTLHFLAVRHDAEIHAGRGLEGERYMLFQQSHTERIVPTTEVA